MVSDELKAAVREHLKEGNIEDAVNLLTDSSEGKTYDKIVITISGQFSDLQEKQLMGVLNPEEEREMKNEIMYAILKFLENADNPTIEINPVSSPKESPSSSNKQILLIAGVVILALVAAFFFLSRPDSASPTTNNNSTSPNTSPASKCLAFQTLNLAGKIDNEYAIRMIIKRSEGSNKAVEGYYYYEKTNRRIPLYGEISQMGAVSLTARVEGEMKTEKFDGSFTESCQIRGTWNAAKGDRVLSFFLQKE